jgi:hypothetical protein
LNGPRASQLWQQVQIGLIFASHGSIDPGMPLFFRETSFLSRAKRLRYLTPWGFADLNRGMAL